jgi:hypothetical protein
LFEESFILLCLAGRCVIWYVNLVYTLLKDWHREAIIPKRIGTGTERMKFETEHRNKIRRQPSVTHATDIETARRSSPGQ